jgi:hypothetical protein
MARSRRQGRGALPGHDFRGPSPAPRLQKEPLKPALALDPDAACEALGGPFVQKDPAYSQPLLDTLPQRDDGSGVASIMLVSMRSDTAESERMRESVKPLASRSVRYSASVRSRPPSNPSMCMSIIATRR